MSGTIASLMIALGMDVSGVQEAADEVVKDMTTTKDKLVYIAKGVATSAGILMGIAAHGALKMEDYATTFQANTDANAAQAQQFAKSVNAMSGDTTMSLEGVDQMMTQVTKSFQVFGSEAEGIGRALLPFLHYTGEGASQVDLLRGAMDAWHMTAADMPKLLDQLVRSNQKYNLSIDQTLTALKTSAPMLRALGLDQRQAIGFMNMAKEAGLDTTKTLRGLRIAITKLPKGVSLQEYMSYLQTIPDDATRAKEATKVFSSLAGPNLANMLRPGMKSLEDFSAEMDNVTGAAPEASDALDDTWGGKFKLLIAKASALVRGFGMNFGSVLTGAAAAGDILGTLGGGRLKTFLSPKIKGAVTSAWRGLGRIAGNVFGTAAGDIAVNSAGRLFRKSTGKFVSKATAEAAGMVLGNGLGAGLARAGKRLGGMKGILKMLGWIAAPIMLFVALKLIGDDLAKQVAEWQKPVVKSIEELMASGDKAGIEAAIQRLKDQESWPEKIADIAAGYARLTGTASENAQGSPTVQAINHLQGYLDDVARGMDPAAAAIKNGFTKVADAVDTGGKDVAKKLRGAGHGISAADKLALKALRDARHKFVAGILTTAGKVTDAWTQLGGALAKGPKLQSYHKMMVQGAKRVQRDLRHLRAAIHAKDPNATSFWTQQLIADKHAQWAMHNNSAKAMGDGQALLDRYSGKHGKTLDGMSRKEIRAARKAAKAGLDIGKGVADGVGKGTTPAGDNAEDTATAVKKPFLDIVVDAYGWAYHMAQKYAAGINAGIPMVTDAAGNLVSPVHEFLAFESPSPKKGPLKNMHKWGRHMVVEWVRSIHDSTGHAKRASHAISEALFPKTLRWKEHPWIKHLRDMERAGHDLNKKQLRWLHNLEQARGKFAKHFKKTHHWEDRGGGGNGGGGGGGRGNSWARTAHVHTMRVDRLISDHGGRGSVNINVGTLIADDKGIDELQRRMDRRLAHKRRRGPRANKDY